MYIPPLKIGAVEVECPVVLAPLAGISDSAFRLVCRRAGAGLVFSEMISAEAIVRGSAKAWLRTRFSNEERPFGIQLFSHDAEALAQAALRLEDLGADVFDLNCGCPVKRVLRRKAGADFMENPARIAEIVRRVVRVVQRPLLVKLRSGPSAGRLTAVEAARRAEAEGAAAVTVHARTTAQGFKGKADWRVIAEVKRAVNIPVIGNGDVFSAADMQRMFSETGCDAVMIGRAALGNPWIFTACRAKLQGKNYQPPPPAQIWETVSSHFVQAVSDNRHPGGVLAMRKHLGWYSRGWPGAARFRARVFRLQDPQAVLAEAQNFFLNARGDAWRKLSQVSAEVAQNLAGDRYSE